MSFLDYLCLFLILAVIIFVVAFGVYQYINLPNSKKAEKVTEWLFYAVVIAEKQFGDGTGQLKLRYVYNLALEKFPIFTKLISFEDFSKLVDKALAKLRVLLNTNDALEEYIYL